MISAREYTVLVAPRGDGWTVDVLAPDGRSLLDAPREIRRLSVTLSTEWTFPQIGAEEQAALEDIPANQLCRACDARAIVRDYAAIAGGKPLHQGTQRIGHYLFRVLFGPDGFDRILADAGEDTITLLLTWDSSQWLLTRLPWEMLHDGRTFLAARTDRLVAIVRQIETRTSPPANLVAPKVLFVVGSRLKDPEVRPGAEYLGLIRRLQTLHLGIDSRVLVEATGDMLRDDVLAFRPSIVHFICHGSFVGAHGVLNLVASETASAGAAHFEADQLLKLLSPDQSDGTKVPLPPIVVLTACYSATQPDQSDPDDPVSPAVVGGLSGSLPTTDAQPLASELVHGGVALAIGMSGKVADLACRLFTRMFYESLIRIDDDPVLAAARGRRNGYTFTEYPTESVDWAYPVVFMAKGCRLQRDRQMTRVAVLRSNAAESFRTNNNPPAFCDRLDQLRKFRALTGTDPQTPRVMCLYQSARPEEAARYGRSRLLSALCLEAVRIGHFPCLVSIPEVDSPPTRAIVVGKSIRLAMQKTWARFFAEAPIDDEQFELSKLEDRRTRGLHQLVKRAVKSYGAGDARTVVAALRVDAAMLLDRVRAQLYPEQPSLGDGMRLVVLLDDVQRFGQKMAGAFVNEMLDQGGFGTIAAPIPVVFTFKNDQKQPGAVVELEKYVSDKPFGLEPLKMQPFAAPADDPTIYSHYLLEGAWVWKPDSTVHSVPLVVSGNADSVFAGLHASVRGLPANLEQQNAAVVGAVTMALQTGNLMPACDDDALAQGRIP